jgi:hypothetical protein
MTMKLGDYYDSIRDTANIECLACGLHYDTGAGQCGVWWLIEGRWHHWCGGSWNPTKEREQDHDRQAK